MCKTVYKDIVFVPKVVSLLDELEEEEEESEGDELLAVNETVFEDGEEDFSDSPASLSCSNLLRKGMLPMNIRYNLELYDDVLISDIHLTGIVHNVNFQEPKGSLCCPLCFYNEGVDASPKEACLIYHFEQFKIEVNQDMEFCTNCFFCCFCRRFLFDTTTEYNEFHEGCQDIYRQYFVTEECNAYICIF